MRGLQDTNSRKHQDVKIWALFDFLQLRDSAHQTFAVGGSLWESRSDRAQKQDCISNTDVGIGFEELHKALMSKKDPTVSKRC